MSEPLAKHTVILSSPSQRTYAAKLIMQAEDDSVVTFEGPIRTLDQNKRLHALLTDIARQKTYHGVHMRVDDWRRLFAAALKQELRTVPSLDGTSIVILSPRTSKMTKAQLNDLMELVAAWGNENGVVWTEPGE